MKKIFLILLSFVITLNAQWSLVGNQSLLKVDNIDLGTNIVSVIPDTNYLSAYILYGYNPVWIDSVTINGNTTVKADATIVTDAERFATVGYGDLVNGWNFTSGWTSTGTPVATLGSNTITTTGGAGGAFKLSALTIGKKYRLIISGTSTVVAEVYQSTSGGATKTVILSSIVGSVDFTCIYADLYIRNATAGITTINRFELYEIPNNWVNNGSILSLNADSTATYDNNPFELNPNPNFDFSYTNYAVNGDMSSSTNWALSTGALISGGQLTLDPTIGANPYAYNTLSTSASLNDVFVLTYTVVSSSIEANKLYLYSSSMNSAIINSTSYTIDQSVGTHTKIIYADATGSRTVMSLRTLSTTGNIVLDDVKLEKLKAPSGWNVSTMDATHHITESTSGGMRYFSGATSPVLTVTSNFSMVIGHKYIFEVEITEDNGGGLKSENFNEGTLTYYDIGVYKDTVTAKTSTVSFYRTGINTDMTIGRVSVKEYFEETKAQLPLNTTSNHYGEAIVGYREGETNIISNSTLETGITGYTVGGSGTLDITTDANSGDSALVFTSTAGTYDRIEYTVSGLIIGETYKLILSAKRGSQGTGQKVIACTFAPNDIVIGNAGSGLSITTQTYATYSREFTAEATSGILRIYASRGGAIGDAVYADDIKVYHLDDGQKVESSIPTFTFNGNTSFTGNQITSEWQYDTLTFAGAVEDDYLSFDGVNDYVTIADDNSLDFGTGSWTFYADLIHKNPSTNLVLGKYNSTGWIVSFEATLRMNVYDGSTHTLLSGYSLTNGTRYKIACVYNTASNYVYFYVNGDSVGKYSISGIGSLDNTGALVLGKYQGGSQYLMGSVYSSKLFNTALTSLQIDSLSKNTLTDYSDCVLNLNGTDGNISTTTWTDASANGNDGIISGATLMQPPFFSISMDDTCKADIKVVSLVDKTDHRKVIKGSTTNIGLVTDISTVGTIADNGILHSTIGDISFTVSGTVIASNELVAFSDTLNFGTQSNLTLDSIQVTNESLNDYTITNILNLGSDIFLANFGGNYVVEADATRHIKFYFNPLADSTYSNLIGLRYTDGTIIDTLNITLYGIGSGISSPTLSAPIVTLATHVDSIEVNISGGGDVTGYYVYGGYSSGSLTLLATLENEYSFSTKAFNYITDVDIFAIAFNSEGISASSDTITTQRTSSKTAYYLNTTGNNTTGLSETNAFTSFASANASMGTNSILYAKSLQQFGGGSTLTGKSGCTYATYGGSDVAIFGDESYSSSNSVVNITSQNVTIENLKVEGYANTTKIIDVSAMYSTVRNCEIVGGSNGHTNTVRSVGIYLESLASDIGNHKILNNEIHDLYRGVTINAPINTDISYNTMYDFYLMHGMMDQGGAAVGGDLGRAVETNFTFKFTHNEVYNFEYTSGLGGNMVVEYNNIHHNLDERIFRGGVKHGSIGKVYDNGSSSPGFVFRYNYVHDLVRGGQANYTYAEQTDAMVNARTFSVLSTSNGTGNAVYQYSVYKKSDGTVLYTDYNCYGLHYGDFIGCGTDASYEYPDDIISGQGYGNYAIHNNIFENCSNVMPGRAGGSTSLPYQADLGSFLVNNTFINCGYGYVARDFGMSVEYTDGSPHRVINNIIDYTQSSSKVVLRIKSNYNTVNNNIFVNQSGYVIENPDWSFTLYPSSGDAEAIYFEQANAYNTLTSGLTGNQYATNPNYNNPNDSIFASTVGVNGTYIPDVRLQVDGNAYNKGLAYVSIGDSYHTYGQDLTGRSYAYDILGNLRTTNDIGAVGVYDPSGSFSITPTITSQPVTASVVEGGTATFSISAYLAEGTLGYQWWKSDLTALVDGGDISGATTNSLSIANVDATDALSTYFCEVKNLNGYPLAGYSVNSNSVGIVFSTSAGSIIDTFYVSSDGYRQYANQLYTTLNYINFGDQNGYDTKGAIRISGITEVGILDSIVLEVEAYPANRDIVNYNIYAEHTGTPAVLSDYTNFDNRVGNLSSQTVKLNSQSWAIYQVYRTNVTSIVSEMFTDFDYSNGSIMFFILPNIDHSTNIFTSIYSDNGSATATKLIRYRH